MRTRAATFVLVIGLLVLSTVTAFAQDGDPLPCEGENVSGMVVAVDSASGTVTLDTGDGNLCTVTLTPGTYSHPIVALLGQYFDDVDPAALEESLANLGVCAVEDPPMTWTWAVCGPGTVDVTITGENPDGTFTAIVDATGETITISVDDPETADQISDSLADLMVEWDLREDGSVSEVGDEIAAYHEEGMGFGVLVKLYAMAAESQEACMLAGGTEDVCGVTVDELVTLRQEGVGMGQLFKIYGKPSLLGIGHVKQELREDQGKPPWAGPHDQEDGDDPEGDVHPRDKEKPPKKDDKKDPPGQSNKPWKPDKPDKDKNKNK